MDLRKTFDTGVIDYDKWRPRYCQELFDDIIEFSKLSPEKECIEIGCGTGQATEPILKTGCSVLAIELGENFTEFVKRKFKPYKNFNIKNDEFEKTDLKHNNYDLVFSGTAFHWISEEIGYTKVYNILKSGGAVSLFWNKPSPKSFDDPLHLKMQDVYDKYFGPEIIKKAKHEREHPEERYERIINTIKKFGFIEAEYRLYKQVREFTADEYVSLIGTYSGNIALPEPIKTQFYVGIRDTIWDFNNCIKVYDTMDLYLARKP